LSRRPCPYCWGSASGLLSEARVPIFLLLALLRIAMDREPPCYHDGMRGIRLIGLAACHLSHSTRPKGPRTQNTLHWARSLPSTMHADPKSLVSPETRPGLLRERHPKDTTRTSNITVLTTTLSGFLQYGWQGYETDSRYGSIARTYIHTVTPAKHPRCAKRVLCALRETCETSAKRV
jgi:hypothetical protein